MRNLITGFNLVVRAWQSVLEDRDS